MEDAVDATHRIEERLRLRDVARMQRDAPRSQSCGALG